MDTRTIAVCAPCRSIESRNHNPFAPPSRHCTIPDVSACSSVSSVDTWNAGPESSCGITPARLPDDCLTYRIYPVFFLLHSALHAISDMHTDVEVAFTGLILKHTLLSSAMKYCGPAPWTEISNACALPAHAVESSAPLIAIQPRI